MRTSGHQALAGSARPVVVRKQTPEKERCSSVQADGVRYTPTPARSLRRAYHKLKERNMGKTVLCFRPYILMITLNPSHY